MTQRNSEGSEKIIIWSIVGVLVLITAGIIYAGARSGGSGSGFTATMAPAITSADWSEGKSDSGVSVIEYGDFECPACATYDPIVKQLVTEYGDRVHFVFRNFPLTQIHKNAQITAQAAEAAGVQGKYWEMNHLLYEKQAAWASVDPGAIVSQNLDQYALSLGINVDKFNQDLNSDQVKNKVQTDVAGANAAAVDHTPTFFVNLAQIKNPTSYNAFKSVIDQALASAGSPGTTP